MYNDGDNERHYCFYFYRTYITSKSKVFSTYITSKSKVDGFHLLILKMSCVFGTSSNLGILERMYYNAYDKAFHSNS